MTERYTPVAIALHWIVAFAIIANLALGLYTVDLPLSPRKLQLFSYHKWIGVTVLILAGTLLQPRSVARAAGDARERRAAVARPPLPALAAPLTGWLFSSASGFQTVSCLPRFPTCCTRARALADLCASPTVDQLHHGHAHPPYTPPRLRASLPR